MCLHSKELPRYTKHWNFPMFTWRAHSGRPIGTIALLLCHDANAALIQAKDADRDFPDHLKDASYQIWRSGIAAAYIDLAMLLEFLGYSDKAEPIRKKAEKWGYVKFFLTNQRR
jgi:hypothetical protein